MEFESEHNDKVYSSENAPDLLGNLNEPQKEAVLHDLGPMLILAGAGSGKTRVITHRIAYLIKNRGVSPFKILALTFTNKAANEMKERLSLLIGEDARYLWAGTFHSIFARILRRHAELLGYGTDFSISDTSDARSLIKQITNELGFNDTEFDSKKVLPVISSAKNRLQDPGSFAANASNSTYYRRIAHIYEIYQQRMKQSNSMDFDDLLFNTVKLFSKHKDVLFEYQKRFTYITVDEYQDTNKAQYKIIRMLADLNKNICVVGDDDQSIYKFRGADISNILDFEKDYPKCRVIKLEQNYRSSSTILAAANSVIANNGSRKEKKLWTASDKGEKICFLRAGNHFDEARFVASQIIFEKKKDKTLKNSDFALLYRANAISRIFESALREAGIPYRIYGGLRFYDRKEIKDILAYLRLTVSDFDEIAFERIINTPRRGIGAETLRIIRENAAKTGLSMFSVCEEATQFPELKRAASKLMAFADMILEMRKVAREGEKSFAEYIEYVQKKSGILEELKKNNEADKEGASERIDNLKELISDAIEFEKNLDDTIVDFDLSSEFETLEDEKSELYMLLRAFLARSALYTDMDVENEDAVQLMSIHSAKGLEFKYVFLCAAEEGIFPSWRSSSDLKELEEERRLAYVAITRAIRKLYITTAFSRTLYGQTMANPPSMFVKEIPQKLIEEIGGSVMGDDYAYGYGKVKRGAEREADNFASVMPRLLRKNKNKSAGSGNEKFISADELEKGMNVRSERFGRGLLIDYQVIAGDALVKVMFDSGSTKKLMLSSARLTKDNTESGV